MTEDEHKPKVEAAVNGTEKKPLTRSATIRKWFFYTLIGGLVVTAIISIIAVLIGGINDVVARSLGTTAVMVVHSLIAVALLSVSTDDTHSKASNISLNVLVGLTIASFIASVLGIWEIVDGAIIGNIFQLLFYALFADVLLYGLLRSRFTDKAIATSAYVSIWTTVVFYVYLIPSVFADDMNVVLPDIYNRGMAAFSILLSTAVVVTVIFHWVYNLKHRDQLIQERAEVFNKGEVSQEARPQMSTGLKVFLIIIAVLFGIPIALGILSTVVRTLGNLIY